MSSLLLKIGIRERGAFEVDAGAALGMLATLRHIAVKGGTYNGVVSLRSAPAV